MDKKIIFIFGILLILIPFISSVPPVTQVQQFPEGYLLVEEQKSSIKLNQDYYYDFFVMNATTGYPINNSSVSCNFYLANSSGIVEFSENPGYLEDGHWQIKINSSYLDEVGEYSYGLYCIDGGFGGSLTGTFLATYTGKEYPEGIIQIVFIIGFLIVIFFFGYLFISNLGHFAQGDYDLGELISSVSFYFVLLGFYFLHGEYLLLPLIDNILIWMVGIGGFTHVAISFLAFIICYLKRIMTHETNVREYGE